MTSDSKKFENAVTAGMPFLCSSSFKDGSVRHVILWDDRYWHANERQRELVMAGDFTPAELDLPSFTDRDLDDDFE